MANKFDLDALKASNFVDAPRTHVEKAYLFLSGEPEESIAGVDLEELRARCQKLNALEGINKLAPVETKPEPTRGVGRIPNLIPNAQWEGRRRRVMVTNRDPESEKETFTLIYEGMPWDVRYGQQVDMPWPYWEILKNAVVRDESSDNVTTWERTKKGWNKITTPKERPLENYTDLGDTPGTENLPTSYFDFFQQRARATNCFRELKIPMLLMIYERLYDNPPLDREFRPVQLDAIQLRVKIAQKLGPDLVSAMNSEMFEA